MSDIFAELGLTPEERPYCRRQIVRALEETHGFVYGRPPVKAKCKVAADGHVELKCSVRWYYRQ